MLILGHIDISDIQDLKKATKLLRTFSMFYVKAVYKSKSLANRTAVRRLTQTQTYLNNTYNTKQDIYKLIISILKHINITSNGIIYTSKEQINTIKVDKIFKLITFGNLTVPKNAIFNEALNFGIRQMKVMNWYGY